MKTNEIYNGDSYKLIKDIPDKSIDLIVTDPPYDFKSSFNEKELLKNYMQYVKGIRQSNIGFNYDLAILDDFIRIMKKINIYLFCNKEQIYDCLDYFVKKHGCNFEVLIWGKLNPPPFCNGHYLKDKEYCLYFWETGVKLNTNSKNGKTIYMSNMGVPEHRYYKHPTMKPTELVSKAIEVSSNENDIVFDPFSGSGTTCVCAKKLNRQYIGFEINEEFWKMSKERLNEPEQLTLDI